MLQPEWACSAAAALAVVAASAEAHVASGPWLTVPGLGLRVVSASAMMNGGSKNLTGSYRGGISS